MSSHDGSSAGMVIVAIFGLVAYFGFNVGRTGTDDDYIPYQITGMRAWLYDGRADQEFLAGSTEGKYGDREGMRQQCASDAISLARVRGLRSDQWSYVCCTVTKDSSCNTKIR